MPILVLVRLVVGADLSDVVDLAGQPDHSLDRAGALWLSAIGACVATAGAVMMFQSAGGRLSELPDLQKIRDSFKALFASQAELARRARSSAGLRRATKHHCSDLTMSAINSPASVGLRPMRTPADSSASIFPFAVPLPPDTIAPAWPILRPGGAVTPAM